MLVKVVDQGRGNMNFQWKILDIMEDVNINADMVETLSGTLSGDDGQKLTKFIRAWVILEAMGYLGVSGLFMQ